MRHESTGDKVQKYGSNTLKVKCNCIEVVFVYYLSLQVMEEKVLSDKDIEKVFIFGCQEIGIPADQMDNLAKINQLLLKRMIHTHGNELLQNHYLLQGKNYVDASVMLRDTLKVLVGQSSN